MNISTYDFIDRKQLEPKRFTMNPEDLGKNVKHAGDNIMSSNANLEAPTIYI